MADERHVMKVLGLLLEEARQVLLQDGDDGLRPSHFRVIESVPRSGGITVTELAERVGMTKQGVGQFVTQLSKEGFLATQSHPDDRRARIVTRTRRGDEATQRLALMLQGLEQRWAKRVGPQRYREFRSTLDRIARFD